jgi:hypothetical protein
VTSACIFPLHLVPSWARIIENLDLRQSGTRSCDGEIGREGEYASLIPETENEQSNQVCQGFPATWPCGVNLFEQRRRARKYVLQEQHR